MFQIYNILKVIRNLLIYQWSSLCHLVYIGHCLLGFLLVYWSILKKEMGDIWRFTAMETVGNYSVWKLIIFSLHHKRYFLSSYKARQRIFPLSTYIMFAKTLGALWMFILSKLDSIFLSVCGISSLCSHHFPIFKKQQSTGKHNKPLSSLWLLFVI